MHAHDQTDTNWKIKNNMFYDNYNENKHQHICTYNLWSWSLFSYSITKVLLLGGTYIQKSVTEISQTHHVGSGMIANWIYLEKNVAMKHK